MAQNSGRLGPCISNTDFNKLLALAGQMASRAGTAHPGPKLPAAPSFVSAKSKPSVPLAGILAVDVGGTHIKVGLRSADAAGKISWKPLLDVDNNALITGKGEGKALHRMATELGRLIGAELDKNSIPRSGIQGVGVVWSNQLTNAPLEEKGCRGVTGMVDGAGSGTAYRKGEWWNKDIEDGDNVGEIFVSSFRENNIKPRSFVIGNDTIFTAKAIDNADCGMVASTGANATIIPVGQDLLCNSESGGNFDVPVKFLGSESVLGETVVKLEDVMAGKSMHAFLGEFVMRSVKNGVEELAPLAEHIQRKIDRGDKNYTSEDISALARGRVDIFLSKRDKTDYYTPAVLMQVQKICLELIETSGKFAALMAFMGIFNQIPLKEHFMLALDSSQARYQPGYLESMTRTLDDMLAPMGRTVEIQLLQPEGDISVPMMGVARATNDFL